MKKEKTKKKENIYVSKQVGFFHAVNRCEKISSKSDVYK